MLVMVLVVRSWSQQLAKEGKVRGRKKWIPQKKQASDNILDKSCCIHSKEKFEPAKHILRQCRALKKARSEKGKFPTKEHVGAW